MYTTIKHEPDSDDHWIALGISNLDDDVGQTVIPLFDNQTVETDPPSPLGGLGLFHKGAEGYGGFIALQLHSLAYSKKIKELISTHVPGKLFSEE